MAGEEWTDALVEQTLAPYRQTVLDNGGKLSTDIEAAARRYVTSGQYTADYDQAKLTYELMSNLSMHSGDSDPTPFVYQGNPYIFGSGYYGQDGQNDYQYIWRDGSVTHSGYTDDSTPGGLLGTLTPILTKAIATYINPAFGTALSGVEGYAKTGNLGTAALNSAIAYGASTLAQYLGSVENLATEAGAGAGEMATYGMGGSGLSGTAALDGSGAMLADAAPAIETSGSGLTGLNESISGTEPPIETMAADEVSDLSNYNTLGNTEAGSGLTGINESVTGVPVTPDKGFGIADIGKAVLKYGKYGQMLAQALGGSKDTQGGTITTTQTSPGATTDLSGLVNLMSTSGMGAGKSKGLGAEDVGKLAQAMGYYPDQKEIKGYTPGYYA